MHGDQKGKDSYVSGKEQKWVRGIEHLLEIAITQPQAAFTALTHAVFTVWMELYLQHIVPECGSLFDSLHATHLISEILAYSLQK